MDQLDAVAALGALAQQTRLTIFRLLVEAGPEGLPAGRIAARLVLPPATLSFHLNELRHANLVRFRRAGRSLIYAAQFDSMNELVGYLTENCCRGSGSCSVVDRPARRRRIAGRAPNHQTSARARRR